jgi:hypothetical protein
VVPAPPAGGAADAAGNPNLDSTSTDNSVEFLNTGTIGFSQAMYQGAELGADATVTVTVTRAGQTDGAVSISYGTSNDTAKAGGSMPHGTDDYFPTSGTLSWADGEGGSQTFTVQIKDDGLNEGRELINLNLTNPVGGPGLGVTTSVVAIAPSDGTVIDAKTPSARFTDKDGDRYTVRLGGKTGSATIFLTNPNGNTDTVGKSVGPIELVQLSDTLPDPLHPKATLTISVVKSKTSADGGTVKLGAIAGPGLRSISARRANLVDDGVGLNGIDLSGYVGSIVLGNMADGTHINTGAGSTSNPVQKTRINALAVGAATINIGANVGRLTATSFGAGSFTAPNVGVITILKDMGADINITGTAGNGGTAGTIAVGGNMTADINITSGTPDLTKKSLGMLRVRKAVTGSSIMVSGNVGTVVVGGFSDSRLFAGYTGPDDPDPNGFNFGATINRFRDTGAAGAFENSRVIATNVMSAYLRKITLNNSTVTGFFAQNTVVRLTYAGPPIVTYVPTLGKDWFVPNSNFEVKTQIF